MIPLALLIQAITSPAEIDRLVADHLGAAVGQEGGAERRADPRLRLARCAEPPTVSDSPRGDSVVVECPGGWRVFVATKRVASPAPVQAGRAAAPTDLVVRRGQEVVLRLSGPGFSVSQGGTAQDDGAAGAWVRVRRGRDVVRGRVAKDGTVELSPTP